MLAEMTGYHATTPPSFHHSVGEFLDDGGDCPLTMQLSDDERRTRRAMLDQYRTQHRILAPFSDAREQVRPAAPLSAIDFTRPPHEGHLYYEHPGADLDGEAFRNLARQAQGGE